MESMASKLTSKGQVTLPKPLRDHLGLKEGDLVKFFVDHHGRVTMLPCIPIEKLAKSVPYDGPPMTLEQMDEGIARAITERYLRAIGDDDDSTR